MGHIFFNISKGTETSLTLRQKTLQSFFLVCEFLRYPEEGRPCLSKYWKNIFPARYSITPHRNSVCHYITFHFLCPLSADCSNRGLGSLGDRLIDKGRRLLSTFHGKTRLFLYILSLFLNVVLLFKFSGRRFFISVTLRLGKMALKELFVHNRYGGHALFTTPRPWLWQKDITDQFL